MKYFKFTIFLLFISTMILAQEMELGFENVHSTFEKDQFNTLPLSEINKSDSINLKEKLNELLQSGTSESREILLDSLKQSGILTPETEHYLQQIKSDSSILKNAGQTIKQRGEQIANESLMEENPEAHKHLGGVKEAYNNRDSIDVFQELENVAEQEIQKLQESQLLNEQSSELSSLQNTHSEEPASMSSALADRQAMDKKLRTIAMENFSQNQDKLQSAMKELQKFKKTYGNVQDGKGKSGSMPFKKRWFFGSNFQYTRRLPFTVDLAPLAGYKLNPKFSVGVGGSYHASVAKTNNYKPTSGDVFGYRTFMEYVVVQKWFVHVEYENLRHASSITRDVEDTYIWQPGALAGVGTQFKMKGKLNGSIMLLYNFMHQNGGTYKEPIMLRFGVRWN